MCRVVIRPWWLRPPVRFCFSVSGAYGSPLWSRSLTTRTIPRRPGDVGLYLISAMAQQSSGFRHHVDALAFGQADVGFAPVSSASLLETEGLLLALHVHDIDRLDLDSEELLDRRLHVGL